MPGDLANRGTPDNYKPNCIIVCDAMIKVSLTACGLAFGFLALAACDVRAGPVGNPAPQGAIIYGEQPKGDQGISGRCAKIVNPAERRKCILTSG
jgi:hypothetical protein